MNAGTDFNRARSHAQANANQTGEPWCVHNFNGAWWIDRLSSYRTPPSHAITIHPGAIMLAEWMQKQRPNVCNGIEQIGGEVAVPDTSQLVDRGQVFKLVDYKVSRVELGSVWLVKR